jgi:hypothetical protein
MTDLAFVERLTNVVADVQQNGPKILAYIAKMRARDGGSTDPNKVAWLAYWDAHLLVEVPDGSVARGNLYDPASRQFSKHQAQLDSEAQDAQELQQRTAARQTLSQLRDIADGTTAVTTLAQAVAALRLVARIVLMLAAHHLRRTDGGQ